MYELDLTNRPLRPYGDDTHHEEPPEGGSEMHLDTTIELAAIRRSELARDARRHAAIRHPRASRRRAGKHVRHLMVTEGA
jgi:hypothetical protein